MDNTHTTTISNCYYFGTPIFWSLPMNSRPSRPPWPEPWKVVMFPHSCSTILEEEAGHRHRRCIFFMDRAASSQAKWWWNDDGEMFIIYTISEYGVLWWWNGEMMVFYDGEMDIWEYLHHHLYSYKLMASNICPCFWWNVVPSTGRSRQELTWTQWLQGLKQKYISGAVLEMETSPSGVISPSKSDQT